MSGFDIPPIKFRLLYGCNRRMLVIIETDIKLFKNSVKAWISVQVIIFEANLGFYK